jgi:uncharacterized lipoprotein YmbA
MRIRGLLMMVAAFSLAGCSSIEPWVAPYDRENLADPIMASRASISQDFLEHVYESREGSRGATGGGGGGCGCN